MDKDKITLLGGLRTKVYPYKNSVACQVLDELLGMMIREEVSKPELPITVEPTQTAPIQETPSDVVWCNCLRWGLTHNVLNHLEDTTRTMSPSSQSDQVGTKSGPVEQDCVCAQGVPDTRTLLMRKQYREMTAECLICHASMLFVRTPVQAADTTSSTSVKQPSKESVENSVEESVKSQSKKWTVEEHVSWGPAAKPQYGITDGTYHILLPKDGTHSMAEQHAKYLTEGHY